MGFSCFIVFIIFLHRFSFSGTGQMCTKHGKGSGGIKSQTLSSPAGGE